MFMYSTAFFTNSLAERSSINSCEAVVPAEPDGRSKFFENFGYRSRLAVSNSGEGGEGPATTGKLGRKGKILNTSFFNGEYVVLLLIAVLGKA